MSHMTGWWVPRLDTKRPSPLFSNMPGITKAFATYPMFIHVFYQSERLCKEPVSVQLHFIGGPSFISHCSTILEYYFPHLVRPFLLNTFFFSSTFSCFQF
jgi:hypothetical protein